MKISELIEYLQKSYDPNDIIAYDLWSVDDVLHANDSDQVTVTKEQAEEVLGRMERHKDCTIGLNWDFLSYYLNQVMEESQHP